MPSGPTRPLAHEWTRIYSQVLEGQITDRFASLREHIGDHRALAFALRGCPFGHHLDPLKRRPVVEQVVDRTGDTFVHGRPNISGQQRQHAPAILFLDVRTIKLSHDIGKYVFGYLLETRRRIDVSR